VTQSTQSTIDQGGTTAESAPPSGGESALLPIYLLLATPLEIFLYANTFEHGRLFFNAQVGFLPARLAAPAFAVLSLLGWRMLTRMNHPARLWCARIWLVIAFSIVMLMAKNPGAWETAAAWALLLPEWMILLAILPETWRRCDKPAGSPWLWVRVGLLFSAAVVLSFVGNTAYILLVYPTFACSQLEGVFLLARVAALMGSLCVLPVSLVIALALILRSTRLGARLLLTLIGLTVAFGFALLLLTMLGAIVFNTARPFHLFYTIGIGIPIAALLCHRAASAGESLAEGLLFLGRRQIPACSGQSESGDSFRSAAPFVYLGLLAGTQIVMGRIHMYYEWGFRTALFYSAINLMATWYLLTRSTRPCRLVVGWATMSCFALGLFTFGAEAHPAMFRYYLKFDKNLGSLVGFYHHLLPREEPEFRRVRKLMDQSYVLASTDDRSDLPQKLSPVPVLRRPHVFFIVVDALRRQTYSGADAHRRQFPGVAWMAPRFVAYDNTWSSYNSTAGSFPALVNGAYNAAWYKTFDDIPRSNILTRAASISDYRCYNLIASEDTTARSGWPDCAEITLPDGGLGKEDPAIVFPAALELVDSYTREATDRPAFVYMHLFNMHTPLYRRADTPFDDTGNHWIQSLYEHNAAYLDKHLLRFLEGLTQRGLLDDSLIVITADHGGTALHPLPEGSRRRTSGGRRLGSRRQPHRCGPDDLRDHGGADRPGIQATRREPPLAGASESLLPAARLVPAPGRPGGLFTAGNGRVEHRIRRDRHVLPDEGELPCRGGEDLPHAAGRAARRRHRAAV
jgi:hypothetical protein